MWILGKLIRLFLEQNCLNFMSKSQRLACLFYMYSRCSCGLGLARRIMSNYTECKATSDHLFYMRQNEERSI